MNIVEHIAAILSVDPEQVAAVIELIDSGNTIPFIARYRKEATGGLDDAQLRILSDELEKLRALDQRRAVVLKSILEQGNLTEPLQIQIENAATMTELEDIYAPYKPKRRTRASIAKEHGLQPLAELIIHQSLLDESLESLAEAYLSEDVPTPNDAWAGARDIAAEWISEHSDLRRSVREKAIKWGTLHCSKLPEASDDLRIYERYYNFEMQVDKIRPYQILAMNRGEAEKVLRVEIAILEHDWRSIIERIFPVNKRSRFNNQLELAVQDAAGRLLLPSIERDVRRNIKEKSENHAITVFAENLRALLTQPPLVGQVVLGLDPGFRTGCKVAVVDPTGMLLETANIYPHGPQNEWVKALEILERLARRHLVTLIAIGNGTASRETEQLVAELIRSLPKIHYLMVNEAGASVYSASSLARSELPDLDVSIRGAVSIARRVQDPLAELVKIDPKSIGVGLYQHDVDQTQLTNALDSVVENVVNSVGVDLNTASAALLTYVAGVGPKLAEKIIAHRNKIGPFPDRSSLTNVSGMGPKAFEQAAGFLRVRGGSNPLDASAIHPESYAAAEAILSKAGLSMSSTSKERKESLAIMLEHASIKDLTSGLGLGEPTLLDILEQLVRPGRDPREDLPIPLLRSDVVKIDDLVIGMNLKGTVRNVVDFGAFIDLGVKQDGLLHRSNKPAGLLLKVGDVVDVEIINIEVDRSRIGLRISDKR